MLALACVSQLRVEDDARKIRMIWSDLIYNVCLTFITCVGTQRERVWESGKSWTMRRWRRENKKTRMRQLARQGKAWRPRNIFSCLLLKAGVVRVLTSFIPLLSCFSPSHFPSSYHYSALSLCPLFFLLHLSLTVSMSLSLTSASLHLSDNVNY